MHALPNAIGGARLGLSVSKKVGTAVKRNEVRRRLREIFRCSSDGLQGNVDLVISARPAAAEASFEELNEEFARSLRRLGENGKNRDHGGFTKRVETAKIDEDHVDHVEPVSQAWRCVCEIGRQP